MLKMRTRFQGSKGKEKVQAAFNASKSWSWLSCQWLRQGQNLSHGTVLVGALVWASRMFGMVLHGGAAAEFVGKRRWKSPSVRLCKN